MGGAGCRVVTRASVNGTAALRTTMLVNGGVNAAGAEAAYVINNQGNLSGRAPSAPARVASSPAAIGGAAGPSGGTLATQLGQRSTSLTAHAATGGVNFFGGFSGSVVNQTINGQPVNYGQAALSGGVNTAAGAVSSVTMPSGSGMTTLNQTSYFGPRTVSGAVNVGGTNTQAMYLQGGAGAAQGATYDVFTDWSAASQPSGPARRGGRVGLCLALGSSSRSSVRPRRRTVGATTAVGPRVGAGPRVRRAPHAARPCSRASSDVWRSGQALGQPDAWNLTWCLGPARRPGRRLGALFAARSRRPGGRVSTPEPPRTGAVLLTWTDGDDEHRLEAPGADRVAAAVRALDGDRRSVVSILRGEARLDVGGDARGAMMVYESDDHADHRTTWHHLTILTVLPARTRWP